MPDYSISLTDPDKKIYPSGLRLGGTDPGGERISFTNYYMELNGRPYFAIAGEFHFSRFAWRYWEEEIIKIKMAGVNIISTYIFWNHHEETEGQFVWEGDKNLRLFTRLCSRHGLFVILRIGPFAHGECRNGGLPDWLYARPFEVRSNDPAYLACAAKLYRAIYGQVKGLLFKDGGPVIGVQIENEYGHAGAPWELTAGQTEEYVPAGKDGGPHMQKLKAAARRAGFEVPLYTVTAWGGAPLVKDEYLPVYGGYAYCPWVAQPWPGREFLFRDYHDDTSENPDFTPPYPKSGYPYACCELGGGMQVWYRSRFIAEPESAAALTVQKLAGGCNFTGFYMFHGGSNPVGKFSYLNERTVPKISYDFQAPLGEYGQVRASYKLLKLWFLFLREFGEGFCRARTVLPPDASRITPEDTHSLRFAVRIKANTGFLFLNNFQDHVTLPERRDIRINLNLGQETITVPEGRGFTLKPNRGLMFPFNFDLEGINLRYATAQPVTRIRAGGQSTYIFYGPQGIKAEFCLDAAGIRAHEALSCRVIKNGGKIYIYPKAGKNRPIRLTTRQGRAVNILVLDQDEALNLYKARLWGRERLIIAGGPVLVSGSRLSLLQTGQSRFDFYLYPDLEPDRSLPVPFNKQKPQGFFGAYRYTGRKKTIRLKIKNTAPSRALVKLPAGAMDGINDIFLRIDYRGDMGNAFLNGRLINDNFYNGTTWEIGLKRFYPELAERSLYISIVPLKKDRKVRMDSAMAVQKETTEEEKGVIDSIRAVPEYRLDLKPL